MTKDKLLQIRVSQEEHRFYKEAAERNNMTLSAMIRSFLLTGFRNKDSMISIVKFAGRDAMKEIVITKDKKPVIRLKKQCKPK